MITTITVLYSNFCPFFYYIEGLCHGSVVATTSYSARGTEPHTHRIWSTSFRLVVTWLTERTYVRTYASTDCMGGVGETIKRKGGVSQACLGKSTSFILDIYNVVNWPLPKQDSHWPVSITWSYCGLVCQLIEVTWFIWKLPANQLIVLLDRDQCSISYFLASLGARENW